MQPEAKVIDREEVRVSSLEAVWEQREEGIYPSLFGTASRGIFPLSVDLFAQVFGQSKIDPRWLHHGVLEFAPSSTRSTWLYVTSGTSNPWEQEPADYDASAYSGIGTELVLETRAPSDWAVKCLRQLLAYNILLAHGRFGDANPLDYGVRVPLGGPIDGESVSAIRFIVIAEPSSCPPSFQLDSGRVDFLQVVGITEAERDFAKSQGHAALMTRLSESGAFPVVDPGRSPVALQARVAPIN